jgi:hypothetical protein
MNGQAFRRMLGQGQSARPYTCELLLPDFQAASEAEVTQTLARLSSALLAERVRLLSYVRPISAVDFELALRAQVSTSELGQIYREEESRTMRLALSVPAWAMRHYLVSWGQQLLALHGLTRAGAPPLPVRGRYTERAEYLEPVDPREPYVKVVASYEFKPGAWVWHEPWASLVTQADGPMIVCLDAVRIPDHQVRLARRGLKNLARAVQDDDDARELALVAQAAISRREAFYNLRLVVLLRDAQPRRLLERSGRLRQQYEAQIGLSLLTGQQAGALDFFTGRAEPRMGGPSAHHTVLGSALPVAMGGVAGLVNRPRPRGLYTGFRIGLGSQNLGPVYFDPWLGEDGKPLGQAYHVGFLGTTGSGKTVSMQAMLARMRATYGADVVLLEPLGNAGKLAALLKCDPGLRFYRLTRGDVQINPLERIGADDAEQDEHFVGLMETMLQRELTNIERGVLMQAFRAVYARRDLEALAEDPRLAPRLVDLCDELTRMGSNAPHELRRERADWLAQEIDGLYVSGGLGRVFNAPTNLDLSFDGATLYDLLGVVGDNLRNSTFLTIFYYLALGGLMRTARRRRAQGIRRPGIIAIDEWFVLSRNPYLTRRVVELVKTARNLGIALWLAEQDLATFAGHESAEGVTNLAGHHLLANMSYWLAFRQKSGAELALFAREFAGRCPQGYVDFLPVAQPGQCVALLDRAYLLQYALLPSEHLALIPKE